MDLSRRALFQDISWVKFAQTTYAGLLVAMGCLLFTGTVQYLALEGGVFHALCSAMNSFACHQLDDRLLHVGSYSTGVCARCYFFYLIGVLGCLLCRNVTVTLFFFVLMNIPMAIDGGFQLVGIWESNVYSRVLTGGLSGFSIAALINGWR